MARKPKSLEFEGETSWLDRARAAALLGTTKAKIGTRAIAGELRYVANAFGKPILISKTDIEAPLAAKRAADDARLAAERAKPKPNRERVPKPRQKSSAQWEAEWERTSARNAQHRRKGGIFQEHHLRMTLPNEGRPDPYLGPEKDELAEMSGGLFGGLIKA